MANVIKQEQGGWWRFSKYRVAGGRIEPSPGAKLRQYDPWEQFRLSRSRGGAGAPPYQSLLSLLQAVDYRPMGDHFRIKPQGEEKIAGWCASHGLLGIMPQLVNHIDLPAVTRATIPATGVTIHDVLTIERTSIFRQPGSRGWVVVDLPPIEWPEKFGQGRITQLIEAGILKRDEDVSEQPGFVSYRGIVPDEDLERLVKSRDPWGWEPGFEQDHFVGKTHYAYLVDSYFPTVPDEGRATFLCPEPLTPPFWQLYSESVDDFLQKAGWLQMVVEKLGGDDFDDFLMGMEISDALTGSASRVIEPTEDGLQLVWRFPSLLASYATMIAEDLTDRHSLHVCPVCGTPFLSKAYQVKFCEDRCRYRHQKREQRRKKGES